MPSIGRRACRPLVFARTASLALLLLALLSSPVHPRVEAAPTLQARPPLLLTGPVPDPHLPGVRWFAPTGHTLSGPFLDYWTRYGGLPQFGYPITEEFVEPAGTTGKQPLVVQYFERSRFEYHPEYKGTPYEILLGLLGNQLAQKKGYPYGWYPSFGHAADFSWIAGGFTSPRMCFD
ncbi:MAG: hypothetical protein ACJ78Q_02565, partial [Chloroflexia bacterium]